MAPPPSVTGISPNEGPPGTRVVIRGERFGKKPNDLIGLTICGANCLLSADWISENKIITLSGPTEGKGDVIVTTLNGGTGTCLVKFNSYHLTTIGPMKESAIWIEEQPMYTWERQLGIGSSIGTQDPLGLLVEDSDNTLSKEDFINYFPGRCGDFASEDFSPSWFLLESHQRTSFEDLKAGLLYLQRRVKDQKNERLSFLKTNVSPIVNQIDTLVTLKQAYDSDNFFEPTIKLQRAIQDSETKTMALFNNVLIGWGKAEESRNALNTLSRFKFLFNLPSTIEKNIKKGHYDIIINDYMRVKNLFGKKNIPIFKYALKETENSIEKLQEKLYLDLQKYPINLSQQKQIIRYLVYLDSPQDPAWIAIKSRFVYINNEITTLFDQYYNISYEDQNASLCFVEDVCSHILDTFSDLWNMGQAYFSGELNVKVKSGRIVEFRQMVKGIIENFCNSVTNILINSDQSQSDMKGRIATYVPEILQQIRSIHTLFIKLALPKECLDLVLQLLTDLKIHCIKVLIKHTTEQIKLVSENWSLMFSEKYSGITEFPIKYCKLVQDVIETIRTSVLAEIGEMSILESQSALSIFNEEFESMIRTCESVLNKFLTQENLNELIHVPPLDQRCLISLSNCMYIKNTVFVMLENMNYGFPVPAAAINNAKMGLVALEKAILNNYLELKREPILNIIKESLDFDELEWNTNLKVTDIRPYIVNIINHFICIHSEVCRISPNLLASILPNIAELVAKDFSKVLSQVEKFNNFGAVQTYADICVLRKFLSPFQETNVEYYLEEALDNVTSHLDEPISIENIEHILKHCQSRMRLQFSCITSRR